MDLTASVAQGPPSSAYAAPAAVGAVCSTRLAAVSGDPLSMCNHESQSTAEASSKRQVQIDRPDMVVLIGLQNKLL